MSQELYAKYNKFKDFPGDMLTRLRVVGYPAISIPENTDVSTFEGFQDLISQVQNFTKEDLSAQIKKCFKTYLKKNDVLHLLKLGDNKFTESEIIEAYRVMPVDADGGMLVDDFIEFLYE